MNLQRLYIESPRPIRRIAGFFLSKVPRNVLFGKRYRNAKDELKKYQFLSEVEIKKVQFSKLKDMLSYAYNNVPFYRESFDNHNVKIDRIKSYEDFREIPLIEKSTIREHFDELKSTSFNFKQCSYATTGGTSGQPLGFYIDKARSQIEWAFLTTMWERIGYNVSDKRLVLRGEVIKNKRNELFYFDPLLNQLSLSTFHMTEKNLWEYDRLIQEFNPVVIHGYPSSIVIYAQFIRKHNIKLNYKLKGIVGISENIIAAQRKYIEETFKTRFFSFYGHSEKLILAGECEKSNCYHIEPLYGYTEILDKDGNPVTGEGEVGELVGTGFINYAMPFIRYRTGDLVEVTNQKCSCGRNFQLIRSVKGRWLQEMLVTNKNSLVSITALNVHSDVFDQVNKFQFEQKVPGVVDLKIIRGNGYTEQDGQEILGELNAKLDNQILLNLVYVDEIHATSSGKSIFLQQHLDTKKYFPEC